GRGLTLAVAESVTGGLVASRLVSVAGASNWFKGGVVAYDSEVKFKVLGVRRGPVISEECASEMAQRVADLLGADVGLAVTGVAGPDEREGQPVGTVILGMYVDGAPEAARVRLPGDRNQLRQ